MAVRKPLVIVGGKVQQLQTGDSIAVAFSGVDLYAATNNEAGAIVIGAPVYSQAAAAVKKGQANALATAQLLGLVYDTSISAAAVGNIIMQGILTATTTQWDAVVTGASGGLVFGTDYFLDPSTAGKLTPTAPTTVGQYVVFVGRAMSTVDMLVDAGDEILL